MTGVELADAPEQHREPFADSDAEEMMFAVVTAALPALERRIRHEVHRHPEGTAATVIFADSLERTIWEMSKSPESERITMIAALRSVGHAPAHRRDIRSAR